MVGRGLGPETGRLTGSRDLSLVPPRHIRGWCNRQHGWFWASLSGFESCAPSMNIKENHPVG